MASVVSTFQSFQPAFGPEQLPYSVPKGSSEGFEANHPSTVPSKVRICGALSPLPLWVFDVPRKSFVVTHKFRAGVYVTLPSIRAIKEKKGQNSTDWSLCDGKSEGWCSLPLHLPTDPDSRKPNGYPLVCSTVYCDRAAVLQYNCHTLLYCIARVETSCGIATPSLTFLLSFYYSPFHVLFFSFLFFCSFFISRFHSRIFLFMF